MKKNSAPFFGNFRDWKTRRQLQETSAVIDNYVPLTLPKPKKKSLPPPTKLSAQNDIFENEAYVIQHKSSAFEKAGGRSIYKRSSKPAAKSLSVPKLLMSGKNGNKRRDNFVFFELVHPTKFRLWHNFGAMDSLNVLYRQFGLLFDKENRQWTGEITIYASLAIKLNELALKHGFYIDQIPKIAIDLLNKKIPLRHSNGPSYCYKQEENKEVDLSRLPDVMKEALYPFQKEGIRFGVKHFGRILIGDEMGVGKTIQALGIAYLYHSEWPLLVIAPAPLKYAWADEIARWLPQIPDQHIQIIGSGKQDFWKSARILILSYDLASKMKERLSAKKFKVAIADEAHYLKNKDSQRSKNLTVLLSQMRRVILLTGTPILAKPIQIFNLLRILRPDIFTSQSVFGYRYCDPKQTPYGTDWSGNDHMAELHFLLQNSLMIRRLKNEVLSDLPAKRRQKIVVTTDKRRANAVHDLISKNREQISRFLDRSNTNLDSLFERVEEVPKVEGDEAQPKVNILDCFARAYRATGEAKFKGILDFIDTLLDGNVKFLLYAHHTQLIDDLESHLKKREKKGGYVRIDGKTNPKVRMSRVVEFQSQAKILVALVSITAGCHGFTLTAASTVVFAEMFWTPGIMAQAEDRAHRISQNNAVTIYYLFGERTLDELIYPKLVKKAHVASSTLDGTLTRQFQMAIQHQNEFDFEAQNLPQAPPSSAGIEMPPPRFKDRSIKSRKPKNRTLGEFYKPVGAKKETLEEAKERARMDMMLLEEKYINEMNRNPNNEDDVLSLSDLKILDSQYESDFKSPTPRYAKPTQSRRSKCKSQSVKYSQKSEKEELYNVKNYEIKRTTKRIILPNTRKSGEKKKEFEGFIVSSSEESDANTLEFQDPNVEMKPKAEAQDLELQEFSKTSLLQLRKNPYFLESCHKKIMKSLAAEEDQEESESSKEVEINSHGEVVLSKRKLKALVREQKQARRAEKNSELSSSSYSDL